MTVCSIGPSSMLIGEAQGVESCVQMWAFHMNDAPDLCFRLQSIRIRVRSDGTSTCEGKYIYSGTAIIYVNPKKIPKILNSCKVNKDGILVLPNIPSPEIFIKQTPNYTTTEDQQNNNFSSLQSSNDELLVNELNELFEIDQHLLREFVRSLQEEEKNEDSSTDVSSSSSLDEESEYLFSVFTDLMNPFDTLIKYIPLERVVVFRVMAVSPSVLMVAL